MSAVKEPTSVKRRTKGENTRKLILNSAIRILALHGIKGTTHRAVAANANIQLSLTTYYFKDIQELIYEAFLLSSQKTNEIISPTWTAAFELIESYDKTSLRKVTVKQELCQKLADLSAHYFHHRIVNDPIELSVEQLMFAEAQFIPKLDEVVKQHQNTLLAPCIKLCRYFNKQTAEVDADIMLTMFRQLEYRNLYLGEAIDVENIKAVTHRMFSLLMRLKP